MDLNKGNALQANMCSLKPGQSREDYEEMVSEYIEWSKDNEVEVLVIRLAPLFGGPDPSSGSSFEWIDLRLARFRRIPEGFRFMHGRQCLRGQGPESTGVDSVPFSRT
jgi:hypothetical protein